MSPVDLILTKLPDARRAGEGWTARCPAHNDKRPSLSISEGDDGRALLHCHAGCTVKSIVESLGLKLADLMPAKTGQVLKPKPARKVIRGFATASDAVADLERRFGPRTAMWTYLNADGEPVGVVVRWNTPAGGKDVRPVSRRSAADGGWMIGAMPLPRPLYHLPDLLTRPSESVHVVEGEKCADALAELGLLATTSSGGANAPHHSEWAPLAGRDVVIVPDNDTSGTKYAVKVEAILKSLTPPARVRVIHLRDVWQDLLDGGDIADVVELGESADVVKAKLLSLANAAEPESPTALAPAVEPFKPFPVDALPQPLRRFVIELATSTGTDPACAALAVLTTLAGVIGNRVAAQVKRGWTEPAILWGAIVAPSGTNKSAVLTIATNPIFEMYKECRQQFTEQLEVFEVEKQRYEVERDRWKAAQKKGVGHSDPPVEPKSPTEERQIVSDVTCEKLAVLLQDNPMGLLLVRDELAAWIGSFDRYSSGGKGSDAPAWLSFYDAKPVLIDRKHTAGSIYVARSSVSVLGGIQPGTLRRLFGVAERESGLLARILLVQPPPHPVVWTDKEMSFATATDWADLLRSVIDIQPDTDDQGKPRPRLIPLSNDARRRYIAWHDVHGRDVADIDADDLKSHFAKLKGICIRVALLFACVDAVTNNHLLVDIGLKPITQAIEVIDWFKGEARRVYGAMGEDDEDRESRRQIELIQRKGGTITVRSLQQACRTYKTAGNAENALNKLANAGLGRWEHQASGPKGGRPKCVFRLNEMPPSTQPPSNALPAPTKPPAADQKPGFVDVDSVDVAAADGGDWGEV